MRDLTGAVRSVRGRVRLDDGLARALSVALLVIWLAAVLYIASKHEFWRDEVRALSLVRAAGSPLDLIRGISYEGHPPLWYLLLYSARLLVDTPAVLPVVSILVALAAATLFMLRAPFPLWFRALFLFGALPLYEYSVMARNYGISMLLLFAAAELYRDRIEHPFRLAIVLALLANANAHSVLFVLLLAGVWVWDSLAEHGTASLRVHGRSLYLPLVAVAAGVLIAAAVAMPKPGTIVTDARSLGPADLFASLVGTGIRPAMQFPALVPYIPGPADQFILYIAALGLISRLPLAIAAFAGTAGLAVFFDLVYVGLYRHQGLLLVFLLSLYWIARTTTERNAASTARRALFQIGLYAGLGIPLVKGVVDARELVQKDLSTKLSSSQDLGAFLTASAQYRGAILIPEPGSIIESVPYYADNPIYLPRESQFAKTNRFTSAAQAQLTLGGLLETAHQVDLRTTRPILILIGYWDLEEDTTLRKTKTYGRTFTWTPADLVRLERETDLIGDFGDSGGDERYRVYALVGRAPGGPPAPSQDATIRRNFSN